MPIDAFIQNHYATSFCWSLIDSSHALTSSARQITVLCPGNLIGLGARPVFTIFSQVLRPIDVNFKTFGKRHHPDSIFIDTSQK
jgi:hypothetical protein